MFTVTPKLARIAIEVPKGNAKGRPLSIGRREKQILLCLGRGLLYKQMSAEIGISEESIKSVLYQLRLKTKADMPQLIELGSRMLECMAS